MKQAAEIGVAPPIHWISSDGHSILMDYVLGGTLTIEYSKKPEIIANVANLMRKVHSLPKNPFNAAQKNLHKSNFVNFVKNYLDFIEHFQTPAFKEHMEKFYLEHSKGSKNLEV